MDKEALQAEAETGLKDRLLYYTFVNSIVYKK